MRVGFAAVDLTPPVGTELTGFIARDGPSTGIHDRLYARAMVFEDGHARAAVVGVDLIGLGRNLVARVRERVASLVGIPPASQLYACTHTHGGPETGLLTSIARPDLAYLGRLEQLLVESVVRGSEALQPAELGCGDGESRMGRNRVFGRDGVEGPFDPTVAILSASDPFGGSIATIVNYGCHATAAGPVRLVNADYPGRLVADLEAAACGPTVFVNGAGADVNPRLANGRGIAEAIRAGDELAEDALRAWIGIQLEDWSGIRGFVEEVELPLEPLPGPREIELLEAEGRRLIAATDASAWQRRAVEATHVRHAALLTQMHYGRLAQSVSVTSQVQALRIGPATFVALPGESFSSAGVAVRALTHGPTFVAGWANDLVGYMPDETTIGRGGYEVEIAHRYYGLPSAFSAGARENVVGACRRLIERLNRASVGLHSA